MTTAALPEEIYRLILAAIHFAANNDGARGAEAVMDLRAAIIAALSTRESEIRLLRASVRETCDNATKDAIRAAGLYRALADLLAAYVEENGGDMPTNDEHPAHAARKKVDEYEGYSGFPPTPTTEKED